jgi:hypothetical protein
MNGIIINQQQVVKNKEWSNSNRISDNSQNPRRKDW